MLVLVRVDNRLIHGQVVEAWLPHLKVSRVVVADDEAAHSPLVRAAMGLAVPSTVDVSISPPSQVDFPALAQDTVRTLLLLREVAGVVDAQRRGLPASALNLGNVHHSPDRRAVSPSVFLSLGELELLRMLAGAGFSVDARAVPSERAVTLADMEARFGKGA